MEFLIAELDDGFTILELPEGENPADIAANAGGIVADEGLRNLGRRE